MRLLFSVWTFFTSKKTTKKFDGNIKVYQILSLWLVVSLVTFITRIWFPIDHWTAFLGFIQTEFAHVPQYVSFFCLGIMALSSQMVFNFECKSRIHLAYYWNINSNHFVFWRKYGRSFSFKRGPNFGLFARSFIETLLCISLVIGLLILFREKINGTNRWSKMLSNNVFVVYFIHVPVVVFLQYTLNDLPIPVMV